jgi:hypothetical protein
MKQPRPGYHFERVPRAKPHYKLLAPDPGFPGAHFKAGEIYKVVEIEGEFDVTKRRDIQDNRKTIG